MAFAARRRLTFLARGAAPLELAEAAVAKLAGKYEV
jgi:hypothetical protein